MASKKPGQALRPGRRAKEAVKGLRGFLKGAVKRGDLKEWRRAKAVLRYVDGRSTTQISEELDVVRSSVVRWLQWYNRCGLDGLRTAKSPGRPPRLSKTQRGELTEIIEAGPQQAGFATGIWTGPMVGELIRRRYGVRYHNHHIPRLLHQLGFSVQRPRKRLARADAEKQEIWLRKRLPAIKKKPAGVGG